MMDDSVRIGAYKFDNWIGRPDDPPDINVVVFGGADESNTVVIYVSWNGATEHQSWKFYTGDTLLGTADRTGFETTFTATDVTGNVWAEALDADGKTLGSSERVELPSVVDDDKLLLTSNTATGAAINRVYERVLTMRPVLAAPVLLLSFVGFVSIMRRLLFWLSYARRNLSLFRSRPSYRMIPIEGE